MIKEYGVLGIILYIFLCIFNPVVSYNGNKWKDNNLNKQEVKQNDNTR